MVRLRTASVNAVRGLTKACGHRMPASSTRCFAKRSLQLCRQDSQMTLKTKQYDLQILELTQTEYPETQAPHPPTTRKGLLSSSMGPPSG
jgi:transposase